jgi:diadenosine tetraphosphatase ApaH/serine/threonine PP2A family protein phosphatase
MRVAVVSDIHANLHALEAVLGDIDRAPPDALWCLGDVVGYGPRPTDCRALVEARADVCLAGNHDLGALGLIDIAEFVADAEASARWTAAKLTDDDRRFLGALPASLTLDQASLYHGSPRDPVWEYVLTADTVIAALDAAPVAPVLVGHSHVALAVGLHDAELSGGLSPAGTEIDLRAARWLLNPGSVGQPRDGDPRAAWLSIDFAAARASFRRVEYDVEATQREILAAGLPPALAARLETGT